jgi:hypothetical protein
MLPIDIHGGADGNRVSASNPSGWHILNYNVANHEVLTAQLADVGLECEGLDIMAIGAFDLRVKKVV